MSNSMNYKLGRLVNHRVHYPNDGIIPKNGGDFDERLIREAVERREREKLEPRGEYGYTIVEKGIKKASMSAFYLKKTQDGSNLHDTESVGGMESRTPRGVDV